MYLCYVEKNMHNPLGAPPKTSNIVAEALIPGNRYTA